MRTSDAREILEAAHVDPLAYSLDGESREAVCLLAKGQEWHVFISERGTRRHEQVFDSEDDACVCFLKLVFHTFRRS